MAQPLSPRSVISTLNYEMRLVGYDKSKFPVPKLDLIPKDTLVKMILELLEKFVKQLATESFANFFLTRAKKKYVNKPVIAKFCQSFNYSLQTHSAFYEECVFFQYLLNIDECREVVIFYMKARKILMSYVYGDGLYHDAETTNLNLEQWVNVSNRIFAEISTPASIERINKSLIGKAIEISQQQPRQSIDAVSFLEQCVVEYMTLTGLADGINSPQRRMRAESVQKVENFVKSFQKKPSFNNSRIIENASMLDSMTTNNNPLKNEISPNAGVSVIQKLGLDIDKKFGSSKKRSHTPNPSRFARTHSPSHLNANEVSGLFDITRATAENSRYSSPQRTPQKVSHRTPKPVKRSHRVPPEQSFGPSKSDPPRFVADYNSPPELYIQYASLSKKHDDLVDFTLGLQKNVLSLVEKIKETKSPLLSDNEVHTLLRGMSKTNNSNFERQHMKKILDTQGSDDFPSMKKLDRSHFRMGY